MKLLCTLLNSTIPIASITSIKIKEYANISQLNVPIPKAEYLNASTIDVIGLIFIINCNLAFDIVLNG